MATTINLDNDVWIGRKNKCTFDSESISVSSSASSGDLTLDISDTSNLSAGDQILGKNKELLDITSISGSTLKLKGPLNQDYTTSDSIARYWVNADASNNIVKINASERKHDIQIKYGDHKSKVSSGNWGTETPKLEVKGQLERKESFNITGKLVDGHITADIAETALRDMALYPMSQLKYRFGSVWTVIIDKISITDNSSVTQKEKFSDSASSTGKATSRDVKLKVTHAIKK